MIVIAKPRGQLLESSIAFDEKLPPSVNHDFADGRIAHQRPERAESEKLVEEGFQDRLAKRPVQRRLFGVEEEFKESADLGGAIGLGERLNTFKIESRHEARQHALHGGVDLLGGNRCYRNRISGKETFV